MKQETTLKAENVTFSYREKPVLQGVSFEACGGSLLCLMGKNGAGKSTLFKCILGILTDYRGSIAAGGKEVRGFRAKELARKIAYVPQNHMTVFPFSVFEMVLMGTTAGLKPLGTPGARERNAAEEALELVGIGHLKDKSFDRISGGEQRLALIARAAAQNAGILLMDEPCSNLDYGNQIRIMRTVKSLTRKGYLVLISTHNPEHGFFFADQVIVLKDGILFGRGAPEEVLTEELLETLYGIRINLHEVAARNLRVCVPDRKELEDVDFI